METDNIQAARPYKVHIGRGILPKAGELLRQNHKPCRIMLAADDTVDALYGDTAVEALEKAGFSVCRHVFAHGEASKNMEQLSRLLEHMAAEGFSRSDMAAALGGGVTGDLTGFAAAVYQRGIEYIQLPTTFLAAIDSSVGGKTAVDLPQGKNQAGAFWQPSAVFCDIDTLDTLPAEIFADGTAEAVKYGVLADAELFALLSSGDFKSELAAVISRCVEIKGIFVAEDEQDKGKRQMLNLGHTLGHCIEQYSNYSISHGRGVAIGMSVIAHCSAAAGYCGRDTAEAIDKALTANGLPVLCPYAIEDIAGLIQNDKKRRGDRISLVIPAAIGECRLLDIPMNELSGFLAAAFR